MLGPLFPDYSPHWLPRDGVMSWLQKCGRGPKVMSCTKLNCTLMMLCLPQQKTKVMTESLSWGSDVGNIFTDGFCLRNVKEIFIYFVGCLFLTLNYWGVCPAKWHNFSLTESPLPQGMWLVGNLHLSMWVTLFLLISLPKSQGLNIEWEKVIFLHCTLCVLNWVVLYCTFV